MDAARVVGTVVGLAVAFSATLAAFFVGVVLAWGG